MILLKVSFFDEDHFIVQLESSIDATSKQNILLLLKMICIHLKKAYHCKIKGYYEVVIYRNQGYYVCCFEKEDDGSQIDFNITLYLNSVLLYEFDDDEYFLGPKIIYQNKYYVELEEVINRIDYLEYGRVVYGKEVDSILEKGILLTNPLSKVY